MEEQKHILVICSSLRGRDFVQPKNQELKNELFGENPIYTFCNGITKEMSFPICPVNIGQQYDFIWFAGCNLIHAIFPVNIEDDDEFIKSLESTINILKQILKPTGYLVFTEGPNWCIKYKSSSDTSLTVLIDHINNHENTLCRFNKEHREPTVSLFKTNFIESKLGNHFVYKMKGQSGATCRRRSQRRNRNRNQNRNRRNRSRRRRSL